VSDLARSKDPFVASYGSPEAVGTPEQIAEYLVGLSRIGCDGVAIGFTGHWEEQLSYFNQEVMPLLVQAGIRREVGSG
jgi:alkanesulfonate monooxygenase SsuD/methylene tetrahydromethanopterin reductase-like flavin-dependent oxidoreductase (luciferase family)